VRRDDILDEVWGDDAFPSSRTVDNVVMRLRRLLEPDPGVPVHIHTVWGVGYRFTPEPERSDDAVAGDREGDLEGGGA
jgi:two-component system, OmpR family, alkaline phosphatase synthesis response regulator PhoP